METLKPKRLCEHGDLVGGGGGGEDRLSSLPDELLTRIISLLPTTKDGIQTSILAARWKYLWTCLPNYKFKYDKGFTKIVDRLLCGHHNGRRSCIENFSVKSSYATDDNPNIEAWISSLVSRKIKKISLKIWFRFPCTLLSTSSLFTCKTLVSLNLHVKFEPIQLTRSVCLPNLKVLKFSHLLSKEETVSWLLSGCPILEKLTLKLRIRSTDDIKHLKIAVPSLKWLSLDFTITHQRGSFATTIDAPNLEGLALIDYSSNYLHVHNTSSLVSASVDVSKLRRSSSLEVGSFAHLLLAISNVEILTLGSSTIGYVSQYNLDLPKFDNVRRLTLAMNLAERAKVLTNILESMPKLQELVIEVLAYSYTYVIHWIPPEDVPVCLSSHLKTVTICDIVGQEHEVKVAKYFLENGKVLEKMTISPFNGFSPWDSFNEDRWLKCQQELLKISSNFSACELSFIMKTSS